MARPILTWLSEQLTPITELNFLKDGGAVTADTESDHLKFYIANNFTKDVVTSEAVYAATQCQLKVMAKDGTTNAPFVKEKWIHAKCLSKNDTDFTEIGGEAENPATLTVSAGDSSKPATILGIANDGTVSGTGQYNAALVEAYVKPILNTTAEGGDQEAVLVLTYSYGAV